MEDVKLLQYIMNNVLFSGNIMLPALEKTSEISYNVVNVNENRMRSICYGKEYKRTVK